MALWKPRKAMTLPVLARTVLWILGLTFLVFLLTVFAWQLGLDPQAPGAWITATDAALSPWRHGMQALRVGLWCGIGWYWGALYRYVPQREDAAEADRRAAWWSLRGRVIGGLLTCEILIFISHLL